MLMFLLIMATVILFVPGITAQKAKQSAWLVPLTSSLAGFVTLWAVGKLGQRFPRLTLPQYSELILGRILGKMTAAGYVLFLLVINVLVIREFSGFLNHSLLPQTPHSVMHIVIMLVAGYAAWKGIEVIARMVQFVLLLFVIPLVLLGLAIPDMDLANLLPLFEGGIMPIAAASITPASWYGEIVVLAMLLPVVNKPREVKKKVGWTLLVVAVFLALDTLVTLSVFGPYLTGQVMFPFLFLVKNIQLGNHIQRFESLVAVLWITGIVIKVGLLHYLACMATAQVLGLKSYKSGFFPLALVQIGAATYLFGNTLELNEVLGKYWPPFGLVFEIGLPLFLLVIAALRGKQGGMSP